MLVSSAKWRPSCLGLNVLTATKPENLFHDIYATATESHYEQRSQQKIR